MAEEKQKIKTVLIPEDGLSLSPPFVQESLVDTNFIRAFAHLVGKADDKGILIRATSDGSLRVVSAGVPFESYLVFSGTGNAAYIVANIKEYTVAYNVTDFLIATHPAKVSFRNLQGDWLQDKLLPVGFHSIDFIHYGIKIKNAAGANNVVYEITSYR